MRTDILVTVVVSGFLVPRTRRATSTVRLVSLCLLLSVFPNFDHALVVAVHAVDSLTCLGEDELVDAVATDLAFEAVGVVRIVSRHDSLVKDGKMTYIAAV